jgi:hypothetical protein
MTVKLSILNQKGHEVQELSLEDAQNLVDAEKGKYYVIDSETRNMIQVVDIEDGQELLLIPIVSGG